MAIKIYTIPTESLTARLRFEPHFWGPKTRGAVFAFKDSRLFIVCETKVVNLCVLHCPSSPMGKYVRNSHRNARARGEK